MQLLTSIVKEEDIQQHYQMLEVISEGEFSSVVKAVKRTTNELFAVKVFFCTGQIGEERAYMENEMVILSQINHPNIVKLYEVYKWKNREYLVLEFMRGGELLDRIVLKTNYTENEAKKVLRPVVDAVRYLHDLQIVHRDLKPQNLLYDSPNQDAMIKLSDFGVSKVVSNHVMTTAVGTANYLAPEVILGQGYDQSVDYWSIGVVLYILLCGYPPFDSADTCQLFNKIKKCQYDFSLEPWDTISQDAKDLIRNLLVLDPKSRYDSQKIKNHIWMKENCKEEKNLTKTIERLKELKALQRVKRVSMAVDFIGRLKYLNLKNKGWME